MIRIYKVQGVANKVTGLAGFTYKDSKVEATLTIEAPKQVFDTFVGSATASAVIDSVVDKNNQPININGYGAGTKLNPQTILFTSNNIDIVTEDSKKSLRITAELDQSGTTIRDFEVIGKNKAWWSFLIGTITVDGDGDMIQEIPDAIPDPAPQPTPTPTPTPTPPPSNTIDALDVTGHASGYKGRSTSHVDKIAVTKNLASASYKNGKFTFAKVDRGNWPRKSGKKTCDAHAFIFWVEANGKVFGDHFDWMSVGQTVKGSENIRDGILKDSKGVVHVPPSGATIYVCQTSINYTERTNIVKVQGVW